MQDAQQQQGRRRQRQQPRSHSLPQLEATRQPGSYGAAANGATAVAMPTLTTDAERFAYERIWEHAASAASSGGSQEPSERYSASKTIWIHQFTCKITRLLQNSRQHVAQLQSSLQILALHVPLPSALKYSFSSSGVC